VRPSQFMEYWSQRPLDRTKFLSMIKDNYLLKFSKFDPSGRPTDQLTAWLNTFNGIRPFIIEWRQSDIDAETLYHHSFPHQHPFEYLVYLPQNTIEPYISGLEDWYLNRRVPSNMPESEREGIMTLMDNLGWNALSNYADGGLELEYEMTTDYFLEGDSGYIQLEYEGPIIYPYSALNYPGGSIIDPS